MRYLIFILLVAVSMGCAAHGRTGAVNASPSALNAVAEHAADILAEQYPPGLTVLTLTEETSDQWGGALDTSLRAKGFTLVENAPGALSTTCIVNPLEGNLWYLLVRVSDGFSVGQMIRLEPSGYTPVGSMTRTEPTYVAPVAPTPLPWSDDATPVSVDSADSVASPAPFAADLSSTPLAPSEVLEEWTIRPGSLQPQLAAWCDRAEHQLIWKAENDYEMEATAIFRDDFMGAVQRLFTRMNQSGLGLRVRVYPDNHVVEVMED